MLWMPLILASAVTLGFYDVCKKHAVGSNAVVPVLFLSTCVGTLAVTIMQIVSGTIGQSIDIPLSIFWLLLIKAMVVATSWVCAYYAFRMLPITVAAPIRGSQPLWTIVGALLLFGETPTFHQWVGIAIIVGGYWFLSMVGKKEGIRFHANRGIALIFAATILGAASGLYDKFLLQPKGLVPSTVQFWFQINLVVLLGAALLVQRRAGISRTSFSFRWTIVGIGILLVVSDLLYFTALHQPGALISILSPVRRSNAVISFAVGGVLFRDTQRRKKALALLLIVMGVVLLCLGK